MYLKYAGCVEHSKYWEEVLDQIKGWCNDWPKDFIQGEDRWRPTLEKVESILDVKALHVFTFAHKLIRSAFVLAGDRSGECRDANDVNNWDLRFFETMTLLFPMLELVGSAVAKLKDDGNELRPNERVATGLLWLNDPEKELPERITDYKKCQIEMESLKPLIEYTQKPYPPKVCDLVDIRNYFFHGPKSHSNIEPQSMSYQHPYAIAIRAEQCLYQYWIQLKEDSLHGDDGWQKRLAAAKLMPFPISGSIFEKGYISPSIIYYLDHPAMSIFKINRNP